MKKQNKLRIFKREKQGSKTILGAKVGNSDYQKKYNDIRSFRAFHEVWI